MTPDITNRTITEKTERAGHMTGDHNKGYQIDYSNMTPDITNRTITAKTERASHMTGDQIKGYQIDYSNMTPDITNRTITAKTERAGHMTGDQNKGYQIDYSNMTPDMTKRAINSKLDRSAAGANGVYHPGRTREDAGNSQINIQREVISKGRTPTTSNFDKGPSLDFTTVTLCDPLPNKPRVLSGTIAINEKLPFMVTSTPNGRSVTNTRINEFTQDNLNDNPYINNIVHKSIIDKYK